MTEEVRRAGRLRLTGYAALQLLLAVPLLLVLVLFVVGGVLTVVWVGVPLVIAAVAGIRALAGAHRRMAGRALGRTVAPPYRPLPAGMLGRLRATLADPMTWRDLAWILFAITIGFAISLVMLLLLLVVVTSVIWWFAVGPVMQARARMDLFFLSYSRTEVLEERVQTLTESRADVVDHSAAEPVESAVYFGVAECLANIGKHSGARHAWVGLGHRDGVLRAVVGDDGRGGATTSAGTGMLGVMRRLSAFDGTLSVSSPPGGPTIVILEVPCALSSPKTTPSSAPD